MRRGCRAGGARQHAAKIALVHQRAQFLGQGGHLPPPGRQAVGGQVHRLAQLHIRNAARKVFAVDAVVLFDEDTPLNLIMALRPDVLVKGSDYTVDGVVGADIVLASGGRVYLADLVQGCSTTGIVRKIDESGASASSR